MKKTIIIIIFLTGFLTQSYTQSGYFIQGGLNHVTPGYENTSNWMVGFHIGPGWKYKKNKLTYSAGLMLELRGSFSGKWSGGLSNRKHRYFLGLPINVAYALSNRFQLQMGVEPAILLADFRQGDRDFWTFNKTNNEFSNRLDVSFVPGISYRINDKTHLMLSYRMTALPVKRPLDATDVGLGMVELMYYSQSARISIVRNLFVEKNK